MARSIYKGIDFQEEPYSQNDKFSVFVPRQDEIGYNGVQQQNTPKPALQMQLHNPTPPNPSTPQPRQLVKAEVRVQPHTVINANSVRSRTQNATAQPIQRNTQYAKNINKQKSLQKLRESLYYDERINTVPKSTSKNPIIESIVGDAELLTKKQNLMDSIYKLKQLNLLTDKHLFINKLPGIGKKSFVYNDYHARSTNNGFSRNFGGVFYTR